MATRYSGDVKVQILWKDRESQWRAVVKVPSERPKVIWVGRAPADRNAVDSPAAYDDAARSAISFADDEGLDVSRHAQVDAKGQGWAISRTKGGKPVNLGGLGKHSGRRSGRGLNGFGWAR